MQPMFWRWALLLASLVPSITTNAATQSPAAPVRACSGPAWRAFDFWLGGWDVFDRTDGTEVAHASIEPVSQGCGLREDYLETSGGGGESISSWDAQHGVWRQYWVSTNGTIVAIEGNFRDGAMTLTGPEEGTHAPVMVRGTWKPENGGVREIGERSEDGGHTWKAWFDLDFRRSEIAGDGGTAKDRQMVANLDEEYQAAVKVNDAATMGRLLAEDFILVTGSGKTYTRAQLLEEATSGRDHFEHQEDTKRTVRIWGNTAVVTAFLWEKGSDADGPFDKKVWFSDTYVRGPDGWKYVFGQSSFPASSWQ